MTEKTPLLEGDVRVFTLADIKSLFLKLRRKILRIAFLGGCISLLFFILKPVQYRAEAIFKEGVEQSGTDGMLKSVLGTISFSDSQPQAIALMKSNRVLKPLVQKLGFQASVGQSGLISKLYKRVRDLWLAERGKPLPDIESFLFEDIVYEKEQGLSCWLRFDDATHFSLLDASKKKVASGQTGQAIKWGDVSFTLLKTPANLRINRFYPLRFSNWLSSVKKLKNQIQIKSHKTNTSMYDLHFLHRDRQFAVRVLNQLMEEYQQYLKRDHDQIAEDQLAYLTARQEGIFHQLSSVLDEHANYLKKNLGENGFIGLEEESLTLIGSHQEMMGQLIGIDVELARLDEWKGGEVLASPRHIGHFPETLMQIAKSIRELEYQKDLIELSLQQRTDEHNSEHRVQMRGEEVREIRSRKEAAERLLEAFDEKRELVLDIPLFDAEKSLALWAHRIEKSSEDDREDFADYLENHIRLLSVQEKVLQERFFTGEGPPRELDGMNYETIEALFLEYNSRLNASESALRCYSRIRSEILHDDFELSSLSSLLLDPLSQKLIAAAGDVSLRLKDEAHRTSKEGERCREELLLQKKILREHLEQLYKVEELNISLYKERIQDLQKAHLDFIHREISVLSQQAADAVKQRRESLLQESLILKKKIEEIQKKAVHLPEKWKLEAWLDVKKEMGTRIMETVTELVESKTIGHHLHHVESKPLDLAVLPLLPESPRLFAKTSLGAFACAFFFFFTHLIQTILRGFPSSFEKLRALQFPLLGELSFHCDGPHLETPTGADLELLRQASLFLTKRPSTKIVSLLAGRGPDYSHALAENLSRMSLRSLVIRCDFQSKFTASERPGVLQLWKKEIAEIPIRKGKNFDCVTTGGYTPFGAEILQSKEMARLLDAVKKHYDYTFLFLRSTLEETEAQAALRVSDSAIVSVNGEKTELLTPFIDWAYHEGEQRLTFVVTRSS